MSSEIPIIVWRGELAVELDAHEDALQDPGHHVSAAGGLELVKANSS
jgi:hypothetical protein